MSHIVSTLLCCFAIGCSSDDASDHDLGGPSDLSAIVPADLVSATDAAAEPIVAATNQWTWIPVEGAVCNDGTQTGIGINPGTSPDKLYIFFEGGGACGNYQTCYEIVTAALGPFEKPQFDAAVQGFGRLLTRGAADNPFSDWTLVYIPYCTGDLHGGIRKVTYTSGPNTADYHHKGHINALRDLDRLAATWPSLTKLVVSGLSAGGYGSLINYGDARLRWPDPSTRSYLIDDSGPPLENPYRSPLLTNWYLTWGLLDWTEGLCPACIDDVSELIPNVAQRYPNDRMSLLSSEEDYTISKFWLLDGPDFSTAITQLAADRIAPNPNFKSFYIAGATHTMLGNPSAYKSGTTTLTTFLAQQLDDDPAWKSLAP